MTLAAFIASCQGGSLTKEEFAFFRESRPCGLILFKRNCKNVRQVRALTASFREAVGEGDVLVLIDQEGGRVQRLGPPNWRAYPSARMFGTLYRRHPALAIEAAAACARLIARDLSNAGITANCAPVADVPAADAHEVIGDRAYATDPDTVTTLAGAVAAAYLHSGVLPVIKHIPGHGRARVDSHKALPVIEAPLEELRVSDFRPFAALNGLPLAMTAHVLIPAVDPHAPVSTSREAISRIIRGEIGFDGLLMCDDIGMQALAGPVRAKAQAVLGAGCDVVLHCSGKLNEMEEVAKAVPELTGAPAERFTAALARRKPPVYGDETSDETVLRRALAVLA